MLVAAAVVPSTALLVPGVAGRGEVLAAERAAARDAVSAVLAAGPAAVVVLVPGAVEATGDQDALRPTFRAAGVPDPVSPRDTTAVADVPAAVALWLLRDAGWTGPVQVVGVRGADPAAVATRLTGPGPVGALAVGGGSVRRGPDAPLEDDPGAASADDAVVAWLADLTEPTARLGLDPETIDHHHLDVVVPAAALAAALPRTGLVCRGVRSSAPLGATYLVASWTPDPAPGGPAAQA